MIPLHNNAPCQTKQHAVIHAGKRTETINHCEYACKDVITRTKVRTLTEITLIISLAGNVALSPHEKSS